VKRQLTFAWGLGIASNNLAEAYALMQGLRLAIEANIQSLIVVGDSKLIIGKMVTKNVVMLIILWIQC
jgi:ribonuclease HI